MNELLNKFKNISNELIDIEHELCNILVKSINEYEFITNIELLNKNKYYFYIDDYIPYSLYGICKDNDWKNAYKELNKICPEPTFDD